MRGVNNILCSLACVVVSVNVLAQNKLNQKLTINFKDITVEQSLIQLEEKLAVQFSYNTAKFPVDSLVSLSFIDETVENIVQDVLKEKVDLIEKGNHIIIRSTGVKKVPKRTVVFAGTVKDYMTKLPLENTTVHVIGSKAVTQTNANGSYSMSVETKKEFIEVVFNTKDYGSEIVVIEPKENLTIDVGLKLNAIDKIPTKSSEPIVTVTPKPGLEQSAFANAVVDKEQRKITDDLVEFFQDRSWQVSLLPKIGTNGNLSGIVDNKLSFNVLAGYNHGVDGFELGGVLNIIEEDVKGAQISGFGNIVGRNTEGLQIAGFLNHNYGRVDGLQVAGFSNSVTDTVIGAQIAGFANLTTDYVQGGQFAGFGNMATDSILGLQAAGFGNMAMEIQGGQLAGFGNFNAGKLVGIQAAGFGNYAGAEIIGAQIAGFGNYADTNISGPQIAGFGNFANKGIDGFQISGFINTARGTVNGGQIAGFINVAKKVNGTQIGIINISDSLKGFPIGLVNIIRSGYIKNEFMTTDLMAFNYSFKSGIQHFYTIWRASFSERSNDQLWSAAFGLGSSFNLYKEKVSTDINLLVGNVNQFDGPNQRFNMLGKFEWNLTYRFHKHFELFGGAAFNYFVEDINTQSRLNHWVGNANTNDYTVVQTNDWVSFQVGVRF